MIAHHRGDHGVDRGGAAHIDLNRRRLAAGARDALGDTLRVLRDDVGDDDVRALRGHALGPRLPDARAAADDQRDAAREIEQFPIIE